MSDTAIPKELSQFFEKSQVALALASPDDDNALVLVNQAFGDLTGYQAADVVGRNCRMLQGDAANDEPRAKLRAFLANDASPNVRTMIVNFKKDGTPFVNLLYMSRLRSLRGATRYIFASQFDVSRAQPDLLQSYDSDLGHVLTALTPLAADSGIIVEGSLSIIANSATTIAQARLTLADLDDDRVL